MPRSCKREWMRQRWREGEDEVGVEVRKAGEQERGGGQAKADEIVQCKCEPQTARGGGEHARHGPRWSLLGGGAGRGGARRSSRPGQQGGQLAVLPSAEPLRQGEAPLVNLCELVQELVERPPALRARR